MRKVTEKFVAIQTHSCLNSNGLFPSLQSAYRKYHSTETALLRVANDHDVLLSRLHSYFAFDVIVLRWFSSYMRRRSQTVSVNGITSSPRNLIYGVPKGSILGPLLFTLSRIDYCNSLLYGLPKSEISKLKRVKNTAARLVTGASKYDHVTPLLRDFALATGGSANTV